MKKRLEATDILFNRSNLIILRAEHVSNEFVSWKMETKRTLILSIRKFQLKFLGLQEFVASKIGRAEDST